MQTEVVKILKDKSLIFWDFDGVIKDSVYVKAKAFEKLFDFADKDKLERIEQHHLKYGGVTRDEKLKIYLEWVGISPTLSQIKNYADRFSKIVFREVVDSEWIPGVLEYLKENYRNQIFVLVTATPQEEIEDILKCLDINSFFRKVYGAPIKKQDAITDTLIYFEIDRESVVMIGDSESDFEAATKTQVQFVLRTAPYNADLERKFNGIKFGNL